MKKISISIVLYNTELNTAKSVINSCLQDVSSEDIFIIDNSVNKKLDILKNIFSINYLKTSNNGFGSGHNLAIYRYNLTANYKYHLIINPDVVFKKNTIVKLVNYLEKNDDVGAIMPQVRNFDGSLQYARRCLPTPLHLIMKRIAPNSKIASEYEIKNLEPKRPTEIIGICGCFMIIRNSIISKINAFDERYFMYFEDFDLARRIAQNSKVIYHPNIYIYHGSNREHVRNIKLFFYLIQSAYKYFNKWGYFDNFRDKSNKQTIKNIIKNM